MITVEKINGYEKLALCGEAGETLSFNEFRAELSDGFRQQAIYGAASGLRSWNVSFKTLTGAGYNPSIDLDGIAMSTATYLQDLFVRSKNSGLPFVIQSPVNNQYYFAEFVEPSITFDRALVKLFSSGIRFQQVRLAGESVFDMTKLNPWALLEIETIDEEFADEEAIIDAGWADSSGNANDFGINTAVFKANEQNGLGCVRLNGTTGFLSRAEAVTVYQALMVIRINEEEWSNNGGVLTAGTTTALLIGNGSGTKFFDIDFPSLIYKKNGIEYAQSNQQSPMEEFGLVYVYNPAGVAFDAVQIGKDRDFADRFAAMDVGTVALFDTPKPEFMILEAAEHLITKWGL